MSLPLCLSLPLSLSLSPTSLSLPLSLSPACPPMLLQPTKSIHSHQGHTIYAHCVETRALFSAAIMESGCSCHSNFRMHNWKVIQLTNQLSTTAMVNSDQRLLVIGYIARPACLGYWLLTCGSGRLLVVTPQNYLGYRLCYHDHPYTSYGAVACVRFSSTSLSATHVAFDLDVETL